MYVNMLIKFRIKYESFREIESEMVKLLEFLDRHTVRHYFDLVTLSKQHVLKGNLHSYTLGSFQTIAGAITRHKNSKWRRAGNLKAINFSIYCYC